MGVKSPLLRILGTYEMRSVLRRGPDPHFFMALSHGANGSCRP